MSQHARPVRTVVLTRCYECPMMRLSRVGRVTCAHPAQDAPREAPVVTEVPAWCPLRSEDLAVRVAQ